MIKLRARDKDLMPIYQTQGSAGCDVHSRYNQVLAPGEVTCIKTGIFIESWAAFGRRIPELQLRLRSSLAMKHGLLIPNGVGTIDADYPDEIGLLIYNPHDYGFPVEKGMRVGQLVLNYVYRIDNVDVKDDGRKGGFGSTGIK